MWKLFIFFSFWGSLANILRHRTTPIIEQVSYFYCRKTSKITWFWVSYQQLDFETHNHNFNDIVSTPSILLQKDFESPANNSISSWLLSSQSFMPAYPVFTKSFLLHLQFSCLALLIMVFHIRFLRKKNTVVPSLPSTNLFPATAKTRPLIYMPDGSVLSQAYNVYLNHHTATVAVTHNKYYEDLFNSVSDFPETNLDFQVPSRHICKCTNQWNN